MSFDINGPSNKPVIRETQNMENNGGGGNLGYMQGGGKKKEKEEEATIFDNQPEDAFIKEGEDGIEEEKSENLIDKIKNIFKPKKEEPVVEHDFLTLSKKEDKKD